MTRENDDAWADDTTCTARHVVPLVMRGLDPRIHRLRKEMDCRVKPCNDGEEVSPYSPARRRRASTHLDHPGRRSIPRHPEARESGASKDARPRFAVRYGPSS